MSLTMTTAFTCFPFTFFVGEVGGGSVCICSCVLFFIVDPIVAVSVWGEDGGLEVVILS